MITFLTFVCVCAGEIAPIEARVSPHAGRPTIFINGDPEAPLLYHLTGRLSTNPWLPEAREHLRQFAGAGYRLFGCEVGLASIWRRDRLDIDLVRRQLRAIREVRKDAGVLLRLFVEPPGWWLEDHPQERAGFTLIPDTRVPEKVRIRPQEWQRVSYASQAWRDDAGRQIALLLEGLAASPEGDALFAVLLCGGEWGEWFYPGFEYEPDNGPAMTLHFRQWLRRKYSQDRALQKAWNDDAVALDTALVPGIEERFSTSERMFRDPQREQKVIDYYRCHQELVADVPLHFCHLVKRTWPRPILVGLFHAYFFHLTHQASGGHLEMRRVLASPDVDFLSSPFSYEFNARFLGGTGHFRCLSATIRRSGKLWMNENDHPSFVGDHFGRPEPFAPSNVGDSLVTMRRNTAHCYTTGQGMWWFDFGPAGQHGAGGWWSHPDLMKEARAELDLARRLLDRPYASAADVLLVYDTNCFHYLAPMYLGVYHQSSRWDRTETLAFEAANETVADAYKSGAVFDTVLLDDLPQIDLSPYRLIVFAFTPYMTDSHVDFVRKSVMVPGRTVVWVYAPGYTDGTKLSTERISEVVGMRIEKSSISLPPQLLLRAESMCKDFPEKRINVTVQDAWVSPTFRVADPEADTIGYYGGSRDIALARKTVNGVTVWYSALPLKDPEFLRELFRQGNAHIYNERNDPFHASTSIAWIHSETGGKRTIHLRSGRALDLDLLPWSTVVFDAETGEHLLE